MISARTVAFLEGLAHASNIVYQEGGLLFAFHFGFHQAHSSIHASLRDALRDSSSTEHSRLSEQDMEQLGRFFQGALGDHKDGKASRRAVEAAQTLVVLLKEDLRFDLVRLAVEDDDLGMNVTLEMATRSTNNYFKLELSWTVD